MRIATSTSDHSPARTEVSVFGAGQLDSLRFHGGPLRGALADAVRAFAEGLAEFAGRTWAPEAQDLASAARLQSFQNAAVSLFGNLFRHMDPEKGAKVRADLDFYLDHPNLRSITFDSDLAGIPLDALHYGRAGSGFDVERFLGSRAPLIHAPRPDKEEREADDAAPSVGLLGSTRVTSVSRRDEASIFAVFEDLGAACTTREDTPLLGLDREPMAVADLASLVRALGQLRSVWHVTSHMESFAGQHYFVLDNGLEVRPDFFSPHQKEARPLVGEPLVFLNICASAAPGVIADSNFPDNLHLMQAGGVIATHCLVNERFATEFARRFYRHAFSRAPGMRGERLTVAESLHQARRDSLHRDGSVASLCYSFHALDDFALPGAIEGEVATARGEALHGAA